MHFSFKSSCVFNINLLLCYEFFMFSFVKKETIHVNFFFLDNLFYFQVELILNIFNNFQI